METLSTRVAGQSSEHCVYAVHVLNCPLLSRRRLASTREPQLHMGLLPACDIRRSSDCKPLGVRTSSSTAQVECNRSLWSRDCILVGRQLRSTMRPRTHWSETITFDHDRGAHPVQPLSSPAPSLGLSAVLPLRFRSSPLLHHAMSIFKRIRGFGDSSDGEETNGDVDGWECRGSPWRHGRMVGF